MNLHAYLKEHLIVNGSKTNVIRFWWESRLSSASRNHLTTLWQTLHLSSTMHV